MASSQRSPQTVALLLTGMVFAGCSTNPGFAPCPDPIPRVTPTAAMAGSPSTLEQLPDNFNQILEADPALGLNLILEISAARAREYFLLKDKHDSLVEWIRAGEKQKSSGKD